MKYVTSRQNGASLLNYAISKLSPQVFSHPVWMRFTRQQGPRSLSIIDDQLSAAKNLEGDGASTACQVLLTRTVYNDYAGQRFNTPKNTHERDLEQPASQCWSFKAAAAMLPRSRRIVFCPIKALFSQGSVQISALSWPGLSNYSYFGRLAPHNGE